MKSSWTVWCLAVLVAAAFGFNAYLHQLEFEQITVLRKRAARQELSGAITRGAVVRTARAAGVAGRTAARNRQDIRRVAGAAAATIGALGRDVGKALRILDGRSKARVEAVARALKKLAKRKPPVASFRPSARVLNTVHMVKAGRSTGSCVAVGPHLAVTAYHIGSIMAPLRVVVKPMGAKKAKYFNAKMVAADPEHDCAILRIDGEFAVWAELDTNPEEGSAVWTIGCSAALTPHAATAGILAAKAGNTNGRAPAWLWIATTPAFFGASGGGIFSRDGERLLGTVSGCVGGARGFAPNIVLFAPVEYSRRLLAAYRKDHPQG